MRRVVAVLAIVLLAAVPSCASLNVRDLNHVVWFPYIASNGIQPIYLPSKGIANTTNQCGDAAMVGAMWHYNWGPHAPICEGVDSVPMIGCMQHVLYLRSGTWTVSESDYVLGFNEPDMPTDHLDPWVAAILWHELEGYFPTRQLVSPAPSDQHPEWLEDFRDWYSTFYGHPPRLDGLAIHCYLDAAGCQAVIGQIVGYADEWGIEEVWVTEFAPMTGSDRMAEARSLIQWMEAQPMVTRYAWFPSGAYGTEWWVSDGMYLVDRTGTTPVLTDWGVMYATAP